MKLSTGDSTILCYLGYVPEFFHEHWEDIGGPESGPRIVGNPAATVYTLDRGNNVHNIVVLEDHTIQCMETAPHYAEYNSEDPEYLL